jgi:tetratricopeptide (TPR) repeat protein
VRLLKEAVRLDPNYALAHGALAEAYVLLANGGLASAAEAFPLAQASAHRALELDDRIVQAYTALAEYAFHYEWNWAESEKAMLRALAIDPNYANAYARHAGHLSAWGRFDEARAAALRAAELSPQKKNMNGLGILLAERRYQDVLNLTADEASSENKVLLAFRGLALFHTGNQTEGLALLERGAELYPDILSFQANLGWAYAQAGQTAKARGILDQLRAKARSRFVSPLELAQVAAGLDDRDLAFAQLEQAFAQRDPNLPFIGSEANFDPIRMDPRFRDLLQRLKLDVFFPATPDK